MHVNRRFLQSSPIGLKTGGEEIRKSSLQRFVAQLAGNVLFVISKLRLSRNHGRALAFPIVLARG